MVKICKICGEMDQSLLCISHGYVCNMCKACRNECKRQWNKDNSEAQRIYKKNYREANKDSIRAYSKAYRSLHRDKSIRRMRDWRALNPGKVNYYSAKRRAFINRVKVDCEFNDFIIQEMYSLSRYRSEITGIKWVVDHIVPLNSKLVCGLHTYHNLRVIPHSINASKSNKFEV